MKKMAIAFVMCLVMAAQPVRPFGFKAFGNEVKKTETKKTQINESDVAAMGAVLMDAQSGRVLWGKNEHIPLPMASTTKIMTAVISLENGKLDDMVKVSKRAAAAPEVKMFLQAGEEIKLEYLLYALMLQSSNDAAIAIAEHVGGSVENFCKMMTEKAVVLGAEDTVFETPNGLDSDNHHATAYDMALITRYALNNPTFMKIINTPSIEVTSNRRTYSITNKNRLLHEFAGANGVKTGFTGKAGQCFVGSAKRDDMQLISVVLASGWGNKGREQKWIDTKKILHYGFDNYAYQNILTKDGKAGEIYIERSKTEKIDAHFAEAYMLPLNKEEKESLYIEIALPKIMRAPVEENQQIGTAKVFIGGKSVEEIAILANSGATRHDLKTSLEKVANAWLETGTNEKVDVILPEF